MPVERTTKLDFFTCGEIPMYSCLHRKHLKEIMDKPEKQSRILKYTHTCKTCTKLGSFTTEFDQSLPENAHALPLFGSPFRKSHPVISDDFDLHVFSLCCLAFGVGDWERFRKILPMQKYSDDVFEFTAHVALGVWDLSNFIGLNVWPPRVFSEMQDLIGYQKMIAPEFAWLDAQDPLSTLFVDPIMSADEQPLWARSAIAVGIRREYGENVGSIHSAWFQLGLLVVAPASMPGPATYLSHCRLDTLPHSVLCFEGKSPVISPDDHLRDVYIDIAQPYVTEATRTMLKTSEVLTFEQEARACGGNLEHVLQLFDKQVQQNKIPEQKAVAFLIKCFMALLYQN